MRHLKKICETNGGQIKEQDVLDLRFPTGMGIIVVKLNFFVRFLEELKICNKKKLTDLWIVQLLNPRYL